MPVKYRCLSYMWGDDKEETEIFVNGRPLRVRDNLYQFLRVAQARFNDKPLWIDALCINQSNHIEKSHQVQRMGQIYENAEEMLIWLGAEPELEYLFETVDAAVTTLSLGIKMRQWEVRDELDKYFSSHRIGLRSKSDLYQCSLRFANNPYWTRTWIAQEILLGRRLLLVNGKLEVDWDWYVVRSTTN